MAEMICCSLATTDRATGTLTETHDGAGGACVAFIKSTSHQRGVFNSLRDILRTFSCQPTQHRVRREGDPVDPIALCECGSASMNVAFEWQGASRQPALRLYLWKKKKKGPMRLQTATIMLFSSAIRAFLSHSPWVRRKDSPVSFCLHPYYSCEDRDVSPYPFQANKIARLLPNSSIFQILVFAPTFVTP